MTNVPRWAAWRGRPSGGHVTIGIEEEFASHELEHRDDPEPRAVELIDENRFLAARDGIMALLIDLRSGRFVPATEQLERVLDACRHHARRLRCERELASVHRLMSRNGAARQLAHAGGDGDLRRVTARLAEVYAPAT